MSEIANSGQWKPGQSGNPNGRPPVVRDLRDLCRTNTRDSYETIIGIMRDKKAPAATKLAAAQEVLNRGWGKVPSSELEGGEQLVIKVMKFAQAIEQAHGVVIEHNPNG